MNKDEKLFGQLWEECPKCGQEPVYISLGGLCKQCAEYHDDNINEETADLLKKYHDNPFDYDDCCE